MIEIKTVKRGCEVLVVRVSTTKSDGTTVFEDINLGGNTTGAALWGASEAVKAINSILEKVKQ